MRIVDRLLRREARLAKRIAAGIELNNHPLSQSNPDAILELARRDPDHVYREGGNWMWLGPDGAARIMCPSCWNGGGGTLWPIRMKGSEDVWYLCDECDSLWPVEQFDWDNDEVGWNNRSVALRARGLSETDYEVVRSPH
jgi:hypothetical protein